MSTTPLHSLVLLFYNCRERFRYVLTKYHYRISRPGFILVHAQFYNVKQAVEQRDWTTECESICGSQGRVQHRVWGPGVSVQVCGERQAALREAGDQQGDPAEDVQGEDAQRG